MRFYVGESFDVAVKGEQWKIDVVNTDSDEVLRGDDGAPADGYCQMWDKKIILRPTEEIDTYSETGREFRADNALIHELVHAIAMESGIDKYAYDEKLISWIANIVPQVTRVVEEIRSVKGDNK